MADYKSIEYKRLKDQTYLAHQCQHCGFVFDMSYPLMYRDPNKNFAVILSEKDFEESDEPTVVCRTPDQFLFAFQVLDLGLDLKELIGIRRSVEAKKGPVRLLDYDKNNGSLWFSAGKEVFGISCHLTVDNPKKSVQ